MENFPTPESQSVEKEINPNEATPEELEQCAQYLLDHPETPETEASRESSQDIIEFQEMIASFEAEHSIEALMAIVDLTTDDAPNHPIREPARIALRQINAKLNVLGRKVKYPEYGEFEKQQRRISNAVGFINKGKVDHDR